MLRRSALSSLSVLALSLMLMGCSEPQQTLANGTVVTTPGGASPDASQPQQTLANGTVVDNIRVGMGIQCNPDPDCATRAALAKAAAIERHALAPTAIGATHFFMPYVPPGATRGSGGGKIVVFDLDDGSQAAVLTYCMDTCFVVSPQPVQPLTLESPGDHGPLVDPLVESPITCTSADHPTCDEAVRVAIDTATENGFLAPGTIADAHYYVIHVNPDSPEAAASKAEYIVDIYIAGEHDVVAETAIGVYCGSGPCHVVTS